MARIRLGTAAVAIATALVASAGSGRAQNSNSGVSIGPSQALSKPNQPAVPSVEHLLGDWGGVRTRLGDLGIDVIVDVITEFAGNVSGGVKQGATFANQVGFEADLDWAKLAGLDGFSTHTVLVNRSGSSDSGLFGDNLLPVQEIFGSGGDVGVHFVYTYAEQKLLGGAVDVVAGRLPLANDFAASPLYCNFMNNSLCGNPKALPGGDIGFSSYPDAAWGGRVRARPRPDLYVQAGVYEVNQGLYDYRYFRSGFEFDGSRDSGVMLPVELGWEPHVGPASLPGHYKLGFAYDTSHFNVFSATLPRPPGVAAAAAHVGNTQVWALADQMLVRHGPGDTDGIIGIAGFIHNDPTNSVYAEQYTVGLLDHDFWAARPLDTIGLLFSCDTVSGALGSVQGLQSEFGLKFSNGATGIQTHEMVFEANYDIHVFRGVNFEPEFQYVIRPNAQGNIHDATVFGFKGHVSF